ncbi:hypothetical protein [Alkaliphilus peptidifermentans]|uniref:Uncharacterized protein n=1 Tax=Alkaliphilus peptidifermentans DSM 18978 TaxID=1120976 RepID=A0A1G5F6F5_9FIRM|nr:hypothetical protein [Alkaliphilus peptidifermentans]SCY34218.1 hypothetical protein SAMN03080606_01342 [Alkaliphilus peptidifermentans DSM 18978]
MIYKYDLRHKLYTIFFLLVFLIKSIHSLLTTTHNAMLLVYLVALGFLIIRLIYILFYKIVLLDRKIILNGLTKKEIDFYSIKKIVINKKSVAIETLNNQNIKVCSSDIGKFNEFAANLSLKIEESI